MSAITLKTQIHTIIMLVGPSGSGKTTFANEILIPQLEAPLDEETLYKPNVQYISSDAIRQELLGYPADKFAPCMLESSEAAFNVLFTKLDAVTTYPINAEFIILDTTGLSESFRDQVLELAKKNHYNVDAVIFDYKNNSEYKLTFKYAELQHTETSGRIIANHLSKLHKDVLRTMKQTKYKNITKIKSKGFVTEHIDVHGSYLMPNCDVDVVNKALYERRILPNKYDWVTIGDVHGCVDELKELLIKYGFEIDGNTIRDTDASSSKGLIFVGDLIDKSSDQDIIDTIKFIHNNMNTFGDRFQMVLGNHEEMVWKWITNHHTLEKTAKRYQQKEIYYSTTSLLEKDDKLREMFMDIFHNMYAWLKVISENKSFIVTHAPCKIKYLEKMDAKSFVRQTRCVSRSNHLDKTNDELTTYLMEEAVNNHPVHIFGHMGLSKLRSFKNKVCIDAGCVYGNKLIGYTAGRSRPFIQSVTSKRDSEIINGFDTNLFGTESHKKRKSVNIEDLTDVNQRRLHYIMEHGIGYIGGTISPAAKDDDTGEFESLKMGLKYYEGRVDNVVLQPKYMGSRVQMYINHDITKCYATSRNGYKINYLELSNVFADVWEKHYNFMDELSIDELVLDGELMPWAAMGEGLINTRFKVIDRAVKSEINFLRENGFDESFLNLKDKWEHSGYEGDKNTLNKKEIQKKYGHDHQNFKYMAQLVSQWHPNSEHHTAWEVYTEQVKLYGSQDTVHYKPFRILKGINVDGGLVDIGLNTLEQFNEINGDDCHLVNFSDTDYQRKADDWFNKITMEDKLEGCVIKPLETTIPNSLAPFMKVRNPRYLTLIYGYDMYFKSKYSKLFHQKNVTRKIRASIRDYHYGEALLKLDIGSDDFKQTIADFMFANEKNSSIDPRL